ncbi:hypothetical protein ACLIA0_04130 [Bacillaceae bacterium W0354]
MERAANEVAKWHQFTLEVIGLWIFLYFNYIFIEERPNILNYLAVVIVSVLLYLGIKFLLKERVLLLHIYLLIPVILVAALAIGFHLPVAAISSVFIAWRLARHEVEPDMENEGLVIGTTLFFAFFAFIFANAFALSFNNDVFIIFLVQISLFLLGKWITYFVFAPEKEKLGKKAFTTTVMLSSIFGITTLLYFLFPAIKYVFAIGFNFLANIFGKVFGSLFYFIQDSSDRVYEQQREEGYGESPIQPNEWYPDERAEPFITVDRIILVLALLLIGLIILLIFKYRNHFSLRRDTKKYSTFESNIETSKVGNRKWGFKRRKPTPPSDEVRKAFYQLEWWASKKNLGRYQFESIEDWLKRYNVSHLIESEAINLYRNVRYGGFHVNENIKNQYIQQIEQIKKELQNKNEDIED